MASNILIYGYGNMTSAMVEGWIASGIDPQTFTVFNPSKKPVPAGVHFTGDIPERSFDAVVLGFKPYMLPDIAPQMQGCIGSETCIISVLAGVEWSDLTAAFPDAGCAVRFMPNLAVALNQSPNALATGAISEEQRAFVTDLAQRLGSAEWIADENLFDLATALGGSGPGFVYRFIDALSGAATELGLPAEQARRIALQMVEGAGALATRSQYSPEQLADRVASPGGMTREGLNVLDHDKALESLLTKTLQATAEKGRELAEQARKDS